MRRIALYACLGVLSLSFSACAKQTLEPRGLVTVNVAVVCTADSVDISIKPYAVRVQEGDQVQWQLTAASNATEIEINRKKNFASWPYDGPLPYKGNKQTPPKAGRMKEGQANKSFPYNIIGTCKDSEGRDRRIIIDPDMIIIRRAQ